MAMSDCEKCWSTPCECGHEYTYWTARKIELQINMLKRVLADKLLEERDRSWDGPGNR